MTEQSELTKAKEIEAGLVAKREAAKVVLAEIEAKRASLSFDAHVTGGAAAKALAKVNGERAEALLLIEELNHAIRSAAERVAAALGADRRARDEARKEAARPVLERFAARGAAIDAAWATIREERLGLKDDLDELRRLGAPVPQDALVEVNLHRAFDAAAGSAGVKGVSPVPPLERRGVAELVTGWSRPMAAWIVTRLVTTNSSDAA